MLGMLLHHRRPAVSRQSVPRRRRFCHPAVSVDPEEKTWMPQRAFSPRQRVLLGAPGEGQGRVGGRICALHAERVASGGGCSTADLLPSGFAARQLRCPADLLPHRTWSAKNPRAWPLPCAWGSGVLPDQADLRVRRRPSRPITETRDTNAAAPKVGTGVGLAGGTTVPLLRMVICAAGPSTV